MSKSFNNAKEAILPMVNNMMVITQPDKKIVIQVFYADEDRKNTGNLHFEYFKNQKSSKHTQLELIEKYNVKNVIKCNYITNKITLS